MTWHHHLAHLNDQSVHQMATTGMVQGLAITNRKNSGKCVDCINGKLKAKPFARLPNCLPRVLARVFYDLAGPIEVVSLGGAKYTLLVIDEFSCYTFASFVTLKSEVVASVNHVISHAEMETGEKLNELHSDNGMEIVNNSMQIVLDYSATTHRTTVPWGCLVYYRTPLQKQSKLSPHTAKGFFVGVVREHIYRVYNPIRHEVFQA